MQKRESKVIPQLKKQLSEAARSIDNMIKAIEQGIITPTTKERLEKLEHTRSELEISIANEELKKPMLSKEYILFWLSQFRKLNMDEADDRQLLVDNFVNAVYLYDDKIVFTFNYRAGSKTVSIEDIKCSDLGEHPSPTNGLNSAFKPFLFWGVFFLPCKRIISITMPNLKILCSRNRIALHKP